MDFGSKFIFASADDEYESMSEEEFEQGMQLSDSGSDDDTVYEQPEAVYAQPSGTVKTEGAVHSPSKKKRLPKLKLRWKKKSLAKTSPIKTDVPLPLSALAAGETSSSAPSKRQFRRAQTNVVSVSFNTLLSPGNMHAGDPVVCSKCAALLSHISKVDASSKIWKCEFCGESMPVDIDTEEIPVHEDVTYLLEPAMTTSSSTMSGLDQSLVVFCVDTSGSMCVTTEVSGKVKLRGTNQLRRLQSFNEENEDQFLPSQREHSVTYISRLQAMQAAVDHQLGEMAKDHADRRISLIAFSNEVAIVGDGSDREVIIAGDKLINEEELAKAGAEAKLPQAVKGSRQVLGEKVYSLEEGGATALGPALVVAVNMAAHRPGSKVILCTDGKANIGLGNLEETADEQAASQFYTRIAEDACAKGVTISVITIQGTDCKLVHLGMLADKTGGQVNIVDPLKLTEEFGNILADPVIATKVKATFILHNHLYAVDETNPESQQSRVENNVGNVKSSSTITFEFAKKKTPQGSPMETVKETVPDESENASDTQGACAASPSEVKPVDPINDIPFQLQIEYADTEGNKALRVITRTMPATTDRKVSEQNANLQILGAHAAKKSADLALQGQFSKSRGIALMNQRLAWRNSHSEQATTSDRVLYKNIYSKIQSMENFIQKKQKEEIGLYGHTRSDSENSDDEELYPKDARQNAAVLVSRSSVAEYDDPICGVMSDDRQAPPPLPLPRKKVRMMHAKRASEMEDSMANMMYKFRSVGAQEISTPGAFGKSEKEDDKSQK